MEINPNNVYFNHGLSPESQHKAMQVINDVNEVAGRLMRVDDQLDVDFNGRRGNVSVSGQQFHETGPERYSGTLSFDPETMDKKEMHVEVKNNAAIAGAPDVILSFDDDRQSFPIFGARTERYEKRTQFGFSESRSLVQIVDIDPRTGLAEYSEFVYDNNPPPEPFPPPHPEPHPGPNPHPDNGHHGGGNIPGGGHNNPGGGHNNPGGGNIPGGGHNNPGGGHNNPGGGHNNPGGGHGGPGGPGGGHRP